MRKLLALAAIIAAALSLSIRASQSRALSGYVDWTCSTYSGYNAPCSVNAYQYTGSYYANIYNGSGVSGSFYAPYNYGVDIYASRCGTQHKTVGSSGGFANFYWGC